MVSVTKSVINNPEIRFDDILSGLKSFFKVNAIRQVSSYIHEIDLFLESGKCSMTCGVYNGETNYIDEKYIGFNPMFIKNENEVWIIFLPITSHTVEILRNITAILGGGHFIQDDLNAAWETVSIS